ncbi:hypothetical protein GBAR_LOCUS14778, partial [Geodia barretti]
YSCGSFPLPVLVGPLIGGCTLRLGYSTTALGPRRLPGREKGPEEMEAVQESQQQVSEALQEYESLDRQLDQLADYMSVMESRSEQLTQDARQLLQEVREARTSRQNGAAATEAETD